MQMKTKPAVLLIRTTTPRRTLIGLTVGAERGVVNRLAGIRIALASSHSNRRPDVTQISAALNLYHRQVHADDLSQHTVNSYIRDLRLLAAHLGDIDVQASPPTTSPA